MPKQPEKNKPKDSKDAKEAKPTKDSKVSKENSKESKIAKEGKESYKKEIDAKDVKSASKDNKHVIKEKKEPDAPKERKDSAGSAGNVANGWVSVEKKDRRSNAPVAQKATPSATALQPTEGGIPAKVAVQVDGQLVQSELMGFLSKFGNVKGTKDCIKEGGTFVFYSDITPPNLEKLLGKHTIQGKRAIVFPQEKYKTLVCKNWENFKGQCPRGDLCDFAHGANELRAAPNDADTPQNDAAQSNHGNKSGALPEVNAVADMVGKGEGNSSAAHRNGNKNEAHGSNATASRKNAPNHTRSSGSRETSEAKPNTQNSHQSKSNANANAAKPQPLDAELDFLAKFGVLGCGPPESEKKKPKKNAGALLLLSTFHVV